MEFSKEEFEEFCRVVNNIEANLEGKHACMSLKVLFYYMQNASTTTRFELQTSVFEWLEQRDYKMILRSMRI